MWKVKLTKIADFRKQENNFHKKIAKLIWPQIKFLYTKSMHEIDNIMKISPKVIYEWDIDPIMTHNKYEQLYSYDVLYLSPFLDVIP